MSPQAESAPAAPAHFTPSPAPEYALRPARSDLGERLRAGALVAAPILSGLLIAVFALLVWVSTRRESEGARLVEHTHVVIESAQRVLSRLLDAETGERGFIITGDPSYLEPYDSAARDIAAGLTRLRQLTAENRRQQLRLATLDIVSRRLLGLLSQRIELRRLGGFAAVRDQVATEDAKSLMEAARAVVSGVEADERDLLQARLRDQERFARAALWVVILGAVIAGLLTGAIAVALARHGAVQERLARALDERNALLEAQTVELEMVNEQLQEQTAEMELQAGELAGRAEALEQAQAQLVERTREAEAANRAKADFLTRMSHELRTPLNAIGGYVDLMELGVHGPVTPEQVADLGRIKRSSTHLLTLINDLLHFAKLEAGHIEYELTPVSPDEVVAEVDPMIAPQLAAKGLRLEIEPFPTGLHVLADREKCRQILINLLANACKFTPAGGRITVSCEADCEHAFIRVADTGPGIPAAKLEAIFDPFVQVGGAGDAAQAGVGLGLPISRDLARGMGGELTVESTPDSGSTFTLVLPRVAQAADAA